MPKPGLPRTMRIEGLSSGQEPNPRDDFTSEPLALPSKPVFKPSEAERAKAKAEWQAAKAIVGLLPSYRPEAKAKAKSPSKPWRRI